jgi:hypothetical protein
VETSPEERALSFTSERASVAATVRHHPDNPELAAGGRRRLKVLKAERLIRTLIQAEPALTLRQRAHLAGLLLEERGGVDAS